jgi:hypothetical protein
VAAAGWLGGPGWPSGLLREVSEGGVGCGAIIWLNVRIDLWLGIGVAGRSEHSYMFFMIL